MRRRTFVVAGAAVAAGLAGLRHLTGDSRGFKVPGGILMGDAAGYDTYSRLLLGSFYRGIAADIAAAAPNGAEVLEVGCGPGHLSNRLAGQYGLRVTGLDLDPAMIERARANAAADPNVQGGRPSFVVGDVASLPLADGSFDLVVSTLSMHHWAEPGHGLTEIGRVLRPGGRALIWDMRPGIVPLHRHMPDPLEQVQGPPLTVVDATAWRWPWRLTLTQRIELAPSAASSPPAGA